MYKVAVTIKIPDAGLRLLEKKQNIKLTVNKRPQGLKREKILKFVKGADAVITDLDDNIDKRFFNAAGKNLRVVANYAVGFNNIDVEEATKRSVLVTNTPRVLTDSVADFTLGLMLAVGRRIVEADSYIRAGRFIHWGPELLLGKDLYKKILGIVGMGRIGTAVAKRAYYGFGMKILYHTAEGRKKKLDNEIKSKFVRLETLLRDSDFVSLHVPLLDSTFHLIGTRELALMKKSAFLINTSRGPVVDERALVKALRTGEIAGVALDVFEDEPRVSPGLKSLKNVVLTPHIGSASKETRDKMAVMVAKNVISALSDKKPPNLINKEAW